MEDKGDERIQVLGKGRRQRFMPIGRTTARVLENYVEVREELFPDTDALWVDENGEPLTGNGIYQMDKR